MIEPGHVLAERYRLIEPLGQGGMGTVWRAEHVELGSRVAVKLIDEGIAESSDALGRFKREAKAAAGLNSAHVVQIFDYGVDDGTPYIAMELLDGESLGDHLDRVPKVSPVDTLRILTHVGRALDKAHAAGVVHRDMKPDNIFLTSGEDEEEVAKVLDFGVAKSTNSELSGAASSHTRTGALVGSPYYMSPEQVRRTKEVDHRTDLWALGVIAYECIVGSRPFESDALGDLLIMICTEEIPTPSAHAPVPDGFDAWFAKACARSPDDRFQTAKEMADALREVVLGESAESSGVRSPDSVTEAGAKSAATAMGQTTSGLVRTGDGSELQAKKPVSRVVLAAVTVFGLLVIAVAVGSFIRGQSSGSGDPSAALADSAGLVEGAELPTATASIEPPVATAAATTEAKDAGALVAPAESTAVATAAAPPRTTRPVTPPPPKTTSTAKPTATPAGTSTGRDYGF